MSSGSCRGEAMSGPTSLLLQAPSIRDDAKRLTDRLVHQHGASVAAILFHGSCLRAESGAGILDLYVLVDDYKAFHRRTFPALANAVLPPSVCYLRGDGDGADGAKVAVVARPQFLSRLRQASLDTTLWARFCQPTALAYSRDDEARRWVESALAMATKTAIDWSLRLGPDEGTAADFWTALFRHTYGAELRVEGPARANQLYGFAPDLFDRAFAEIAPSLGATPSTEGRFRSPVTEDFRRRSATAWRRRRVIGKALNIARLVKALFTFDGGIDYIVGKLERHSGQKVDLTPWQRRHPLLAAPGVLLTLRRRGVIR